MMLGAPGQAIDEKIAVGGHGVQAGLGGNEPAVRRRDMFGDGGADQRLVRGRDPSVVGVGVDRFVTMVVLGDLDASLDAGLGRNSIVHAMPGLAYEYWSAAARKWLSINWIEPVHHLTGDPQWGGKAG